MSRKVFISILGTGFYNKCTYASKGFISTETRFAQQAVLELIAACEWNPQDACYIFTTERAEKDNWDVRKRKNFNEEDVKYTGLDAILKKMELPFSPESKAIPDGRNEEEMWEIFSIIFNLLEDNDELYVDLTHSFRYLPMLLLVLSNYAKFLKNITVKHISYGNFEARDLYTNKAPIVDLLPISALQDWTFAAADYLENGNTDRLKLLSKSTLDPILREAKGKDKNAKLMEKLIDSIHDATEDFQTCRGMNIVNAIHIKKVKESLSQMESSFIKPLNPLIKKLESSFKPFDSDFNVHNGFHAAQWCYNNGLYQQSATILQENIVTYFCNRHNIEIDDEAQRNLINSAFGIYLNNTAEEKWRMNDEEKEKTKTILADKELTNEDMANSFGRLTQLRNDINHCGMRSKRVPMTTKKIKKTLEKETAILFNLFDVNPA